MITPDNCSKRCGPKNALEKSLRSFPTFSTNWMMDMMAKPPPHAHETWDAFRISFDLFHMFHVLCDLGHTRFDPIRTFRSDFAKNEAVDDFLDNMGSSHITSSHSQCSHVMTQRLYCYPRSVKPHLVASHRRQTHHG